MTLQQRAVKSVARLLANPSRFGPSILRSVEFVPESIQLSAKGLAFPFVATGRALNASGSMHGGALTSLADVFTTIHLWAADGGALEHVSIFLDTKMLGTVVPGTNLVCQTQILRRGKRLAFTEFTFLDVSKGGAIVAQGSHTKAFL